MLTSTLRHSWLADPARGQELHSRKSCCLRVPSSLALHTTLGLPTSTYMWQQTKVLPNDAEAQKSRKYKCKGEQNTSQMIRQKMQHINV